MSAPSPERRAARAWLVLLAIVLAVAVARPAAAYSVLAHESIVDAAWADLVAPLLRQRYPNLESADLMRARAFAYGGAVIQDLGYYPFGSHLFTNLTHYTRSGDFVEALLRDAQSADELAFALGALAHYAADVVGHAGGINRAVPLIYPKLRTRFGDTVTFADDKRRHVMVEFAFDVVHVAAGAYVPDAYRAFIGFEVATPLLERAFRETYGLELKDLFIDEDLAIGTYRWAAGSAIPEITRVAWKEKQDEIRAVTPAVEQTAFVYTFSRRDYEAAFGTKYRRPGLFARFVVLLAKIVPKVGPFSPLAFTAPTPEAERLFAESFAGARDRYRRMLVDARDLRIALPNVDFDTGRPAAWGEYPLADETYADLLDRLADRKFQGAPAALLRDLTRFFAPMASQPLPADRKMRKRIRAIREQLAALPH